MSALHREELSVAKAAERKNVHQITIRRWIAEGYLPAHRVGPKLIRIYADDLDRMTQSIGTV